jgi:hypothetical protein
MPLVYLIVVEFKDHARIVDSGMTELAKKKGILICFFGWVNLIIFSYHRFEQSCHSRYKRL